MSPMSQWTNNVELIMSNSRVTPTLHSKTSSSSLSSSSSSSSSLTNKQHHVSNLPTHHNFICFDMLLFSTGVYNLHRVGMPPKKTTEPCWVCVFSVLLGNTMLSLKMFIKKSLDNFHQSKHFLAHQITHWKIMNWKTCSSTFYLHPT